MLVLLCRCSKQPACSQPCGRLIELWDNKQVTQLSKHPKIHRIIALGAHFNTHERSSVYRYHVLLPFVAAFPKIEQQSFI